MKIHTGANYYWKYFKGEDRGLSAEHHTGPLETLPTGGHTLTTLQIIKKVQDVKEESVF